MTEIGPRCGEPYAWLERRRHEDRVYLYAVHERVENGARRRRRCYLGPEEEAGQKPKEARASPRLEAEEVLSEGEEGIEPAALTSLTAPTAVGGPGPYEDEFREFVRWARSRGLAPCDVKRLLGMRSPGCEEEGKGGEAMPRREGEDDLLAEAKRAIRMKVQMDLLGGMGILREERGGGATLDASEILMLMSAVGRRDDLDLMEKAERGAREEERERWMALAEALRRRRSPEEDLGLDGKVGRLVGERLRAALAAEEPRGA